MSTPTIRSSFTIGAVVPQTASMKVSATSKVELLRSTGGSSVWQTYATNTVINVPLGVVASTASASGIFQVCGIIDAQTWCWGHNDKGQLGTGDYTDTTVPVRVARLAGALQGKTDKLVAAGDLYACLVTTTNEVYCMGYNWAGQIGDGTTTSRNVPTAVDTSTGLAGKVITDLITTDSTTCVVANGDVYCWGRGTNGDLGNGSSSNQTKPVRVANIGQWMGKPVTAIAGTPTGHFACAIAAGAAYCWGQNDRGQLGDRTTTDRNAPVAVYTGGVMSGKTIVDIAAAAGNPNNPAADPGTADGMRRGHACAVTSDGGLYCWGSNQYGQMGQGSTSLSVQSQPIKVNGLLSGKNVIKVATAYATPCALTDQNQMYCWGQNVGAVGDGTTTDRYSPTPVVLQDPGLLGKTITFISGGVNRNCAVADGSTYCWGNNSEGQIGDGTTVRRTVPTEASFLKKRLPSIYF